MLFAKIKSEHYLNIKIHQNYDKFPIFYPYQKKIYNSIGFLEMVEDLMTGLM